MVVACTSPFHCSVFGGFSDSHTESCHRCNTIRLHLVLTPGSDDAPLCKIAESIVDPLCGENAEIIHMSTSASTILKISMTVVGVGTEQ